MKTNKLKRDLFIILLSSFIVILCWIGFSIYSSAVSSTIDETLTKQLIPIVPTFDSTTIENIKKRKPVGPIYELEGVASDEAELSPTPTVPPLIEIEKEDVTIDEEFEVELLNETVASEEGNLLE